jgi:hypothetical protein
MEGLAGTGSPSPQAGRGGVSELAFLIHYLVSSPMNVKQNSKLKVPQEARSPTTSPVYTHSASSWPPARCPGPAQLYLYVLVLGKRPEDAMSLGLVWKSLPQGSHCLLSQSS